MTDYYSISVSFAFLALLVLAVFFLKSQGFGRRFGRPASGQRFLLLLKFPKEENLPGSALGWKDEIGISEIFYDSLSRFNGEAVFEAAVHHVGEEIHFYLIGDRKTLDFAGRRIQALWPGVQMNLVEDYDIFNPQGFNEAVYFQLAHDFSLSLKTYKNADTDVFASVLGGLSRLEEIGEGAALQLIVRPAPNFLRKKITNKNKLAKPLFEANLRLVVSASSQFKVKELLENLVNNFSQFSSLRENELKALRPRNVKNFNFDFSFRDFDREQIMLVNSEELASVFHFPTNSTAAPRIKWLKSKETKPPANLADRGVIIGENVFRGRVQPAYLDYPDRAYHLEIIGQAGTGKSTSVINMAVQDIRQGKGVAVFDPEGDIIKGVLGSLPKNRLTDAIYFEPTDIWHPFGLNFLEAGQESSEEKIFIIEETAAILEKLFVKEPLAPTFEKYLKNALRILMADFRAEPATLLDVPRFFTDYAFRQKKIERAGDPNLAEFFKNEVGLHEVTPFITSKFNNLVANDYLRPVLGQARSAFNFRKAMDAGKIILVNLGKNRLGEANANLLGMIFFEKLALAAFSRINQTEEQRRPFYVYLDEFQNYVTDSLAVMLASAHKYGLHLVTVHRSTDELSAGQLNLVGHFGSLVVFRVGLEDARILIDKFSPEFSANDLIGLDNFNACARILIKGKSSSPFSMRVLLPPPADPVLSQEAIDLSRNVYGQDRQKVEMEIYERLSPR